MLTQIVAAFITVPGGTAMLTVAIALAVFAVALVQHARSAVLAGSRQASAHRTSAREQIRATAFLPQRDPDDAGRPRPRAPGRSFATV